MSCTYVSDDLINEEPFVKISFLDVGQGLAVLLEFDGLYAMYDMGCDSVGVIDSLLARGIDTLEWVVLSHNHRDHMGAFMELVKESNHSYLDKSFRIYVRQLFVGPDTSASFVYDSILSIVSRFDIPMDTLYRGKNWTSKKNDGLKLNVLWPTEYIQVGENNSSVVLRIEYGKSSVLLTGDIDTTVERRVLELSPTLSASLLQVSHHGSNGSNSLRFLSTIEPEYAVVSSGKKNPYGHPATSVISKYNLILGDSLNLFRTDKIGTVDFELHYELGIMKD